MPVTHHCTNGSSASEFESEDLSACDSPLYQRASIDGHRVDPDPGVEGHPADHDGQAAHVVVDRVPDRPHGGSWVRPERASKDLGGGKTRQGDTQTPGVRGEVCGTVFVSAGSCGTYNPRTHVPACCMHLLHASGSTLLQRHPER